MQRSRVNTRTLFLVESGEAQLWPDFLVLLAHSAVQLGLQASNLAFLSHCE